MVAAPPDKTPVAFVKELPDVGLRLTTPAGEHDQLPAPALLLNVSAWPTHILCEDPVIAGNAFTDTAVVTVLVPHPLYTT